MSLLHFKTFPMTPTLLRVRAVCLPWTKKAWCNLPLVNSLTSSPAIFLWPGPCFGFDPTHRTHSCLKLFLFTLSSAYKFPPSRYLPGSLPFFCQFFAEMLPFGEIFLLTYIKLQKFPHPNTPLLTCNFLKLVWDPLGAQLVKCASKGKTVL